MPPSSGSIFNRLHVKNERPIYTYIEIGLIGVIIFLSQHALISATALLYPKDQAEHVLAIIVLVAVIIIVFWLWQKWGIYDAARRRKKRQLRGGDVELGASDTDQESESTNSVAARFDLYSDAAVFEPIDIGGERPHPKPPVHGNSDLVLRTTGKKKKGRGRGLQIVASSDVYLPSK